jgi:hypothetical protein
VFVADLDAATPILVVAPAAPAASVPEPEAEVEAAIVPKLEPEPEPEPGIAGEAETADVEDADVWEAPAEGETIADDAESAQDGAGLAGALKRAAGALESEGIVAPESIGPEPAQEAAPGAADTAWPWDSASSAEPEPVAEVAVPEPADEAPVPAYVPDPFEEPSVDGGDILQTTADDETVALGRPVVMGAYADEIAALTGETSAEPPVMEAPVMEEAPVIEEESMLADASAVEDLPVVVPAGIAEAETSGIEGILADLEPIEPAPAVDDSASSDVDALTCADCIYENTCPNKADLDPSRCGTFQWKSQ